MRKLKILALALTVLAIGAWGGAERPHTVVVHAEDNWNTIEDYFRYEIADGWFTGTMNPVYYCRYIYTNGDTNDILITSKSIDYTNDKVTFTTTDTTRDGTDSLYKLHLLNVYDSIYTSYLDTIPIGNGENAHVIYDIILSES